MVQVKIELKVLENQFAAILLLLSAILLIIKVFFWFLELGTPHEFVADEILSYAKDKFFNG